ncbi:MAG TPA: hypothetical protein ENH85_06925 [Candidatus Scalindua sp.]|nr:hypothetical protein [Candidatus Scalindua sp.]
MEAISLKKNQEVNNISMRPADNKGCILSYTLYTPSMQHSDSEWDEKTEVYTDDQVEDVVLPRILQLYRASYANSMAKNSEAPPMAKGGY